MRKILKKNNFFVSSHHLGDETWIRNLKSFLSVNLMNIFTTYYVLTTRPVVGDIDKHYLFVHETHFYG